MAPADNSGNGRGRQRRRQAETEAAAGADNNQPDVDDTTSLPSSRARLTLKSELLN
jgi:hypothetical protein